MPSHSSHERINQLALIILIMTLFYINIGYNYIFIFSAVFLFATYFITPDLDIDSKIYRRWWLLRFFWYPYKEIFNHGQTSHNLVLGPALLMLYTCLPVVIVMYMCDIPIDMNFYIACAGLFASIELHIISDMIIKGDG